MKRVDLPLHYVGKKWGGAVITGRQPSGLIISASGRGRFYAAYESEGWWRDFAECDLENEDRVLSFVKQRGDPSGTIETTLIARTADWVQPQKVLKAVAAGWEGGKFAGGCDEFSPVEWGASLDVSYERWSPRIQARNLMSFMLASAADAVFTKVTMRRCRHCQSWFHERRRGREFCSPGCRSAECNGRVSPYAVAA